MILGADGRPVQAPGAPVEVALDELTPEEQFTVLWLRAIQPEATPWHVAEFRQAALGMSVAQSDSRLLAGIDGLLARGFLQPVRDASGNPVVDAKGRPSVQVAGRLVTRMKSVGGPNKAH